MSKNAAIEVILRVRPHKNPYENFRINLYQCRFE